MTQKPMLRAEVYARALRASQNRKEDTHLRLSSPVICKNVQRRVRFMSMRFRLEANLSGERLCVLCTLIYNQAYRTFSASYC